MWRNVTPSSIVFALTIAYGGHLLAAPPPFCETTEPGKLRCAIGNAADCDKINDYPYARDLFCAAAFSAAQEMVAEVAKTLGVNAPKNGFFYFYQTLPTVPPPDSPQTTVSCTKTPAPFPGSKDVIGAGVPLCDLVAYVTSPGPDAKKTRKDDPIPAALRDYPDYYSKLFAPKTKHELNHFRTGQAFDKLVSGLGAAGYDGFIKEAHGFSTTTLYDPDHFSKDGRYTGLSGGGGGGWGGEIAILGTDGPVVQFAFGGGGGGGMNSYQPDVPPGPGKKPKPIAISGLGAGGGGGAQFANGYFFGGTSYNGLGLGAGAGDTSLVPKSPVQYTYSDYPDSGRPQPTPLPHEFNAGIVGDYEAQLQNLAAQLKSAYGSDGTVVIRGGGGMGAGTQYLSSTGAGSQALSTQGGFQFNYEFAKNLSSNSALGVLNDVQQNIYEAIGESWQIAADVAFKACGSDYSKFDCMCPIEHAIVICKAKEAVGGDAAKIPGWLQQRHCPGDDNSNVLSPYSPYQRHLLSVVSAINDSEFICGVSLTDALTDFFDVQNTPVGP